MGITFKIGYVATALIFLAFFLVVVVVLGTSMVGTEISDFSNRGFGHGSTQQGIGYAWGAVILTSILAIVFLVWWRTGQTYDVENIATRKGEILHWITILVSNTLGTSSGDWLSDDTGLGFRNAFFIIAGIMIVIVAAHYLTNINGMVLFWLAFILTRPLGGSAAPLTLLIVLVIYQTIQVRRQPLSCLALPVSRLTGQPQRPNGQIIKQTTSSNVFDNAS